MFVLSWFCFIKHVVKYEMFMHEAAMMNICFQIDLRFEARNMERFTENFRHIDHVKFPTPLRPFVTRNILVETFEVSF